MATRTLNAKTDLTYEEIFEGYANGKSRLPKVLKDIAAGTGTFSTLANDAGVDILRRRTGGGNSENSSNVGVSISSPVAKLISAARYNTLLAGYDPVGGQPSQNYIDADVRGVTKDTFDLLDFVSGVNNSEQSKGSGNKLSTRAAKLKAQGSNVVTRDFTELVALSDQGYNVRTKFGDRVGGGGATGEVHGVDQGIPGLIATDSQAILIGATGETFDMSGDTDMDVEVDNAGVDAVIYPASTLSRSAVVALTNGQLSSGEAVSIGEQIALRSSGLGSQGEISVTGENTVLDFPFGTVVGATVGASSLSTNDTVVSLGAAAVNTRTNIRYGTYQFGVLRIYTSINDAAPVAYILHPDLLDDLVANQ
jgi:hypothetical protein